MKIFCRRYYIINLSTPFKLQSVKIFTFFFLRSAANSNGLLYSSDASRAEWRQRERRGGVGARRLPRAQNCWPACEDTAATGKVLGLQWLQPHPFPSVTWRTYFGMHTDVM